MTALTIVDRPAPSESYYVPRLARPVRGVVTHHTGTPFTANPGYGASYHWQVSREEDGNGHTVVYRHMPERFVAHGAGNTLRWWPPWVPRGKTPGWSGSKVNYVAIHIEIVYAPQAPHLQIPTPAQCATTEELLRDICARWGPLPVVGHGEIDTTKWLTEPHWINGEVEGRSDGPEHWDAIGLTIHDENGHWLGPEEEDVIEIDDAALKAYMESYGIPVNMDTAIMKRAAQAYRRGETRGPALSGEYDYDGKVRQRFTAGIGEWSADTGEATWAEVVLHPE